MAVISLYRPTLWWLLQKTGGSGLRTFTAWTLPDYLEQHFFYSLFKQPVWIATRRTGGGALGADLTEVDLDVTTEAVG